jgi:hypothetical protein
MHTPQEVTDSIAYARKVGKTVVAILISRAGEMTYVAVKLK